VSHSQSHRVKILFPSGLGQTNVDNFPLTTQTTANTWKYQPASLLRLYGKPPAPTPTHSWHVTEILLGYHCSLPCTGWTSKRTIFSITALALRLHTHKVHIFNRPPLTSSPAVRALWLAFCSAMQIIGCRLSSVAEFRLGNLQSWCMVVLVLQYALCSHHVFRL